MRSIYKNKELRVFLAKNPRFEFWRTQLILAISNKNVG